MKLTPSEVTHMRKTLAWLRCEYCLDEDMQRGALGAVKSLLDSGDITQAQAGDEVQRRSEQISQVPQYVRQAVKMLTKALRAHDGVKGAVLDVQSRDVQELTRD